MTTYRCVGCDAELQKDDGKNETIKGLCGECFARDPKSVKKMTYRALKFKGESYERV